MTYNNRQLEPLLINKSDFGCVTQVAQHCDWDQMTMYIREQQNLSLLPKIGACLFDKLLRYCQGFRMEMASGSCSEQEEDVLKHLFIGGRYEACDGTIKMHFGLKRSLVHWTYGAYIYRHGIVDTAFGAVQKISESSLPIDLKELSKINVEQRNNAEFYFQMTKDYLCSVKDCPVLADCNICDCIKDCKCNTCCNKATGKTKQNRGVRFKNISKYEDYELRKYTK